MKPNALSQGGLLQMILDNLGEGVIVADKDGKIILFNPMAEKITGQPAEDTPYPEWTETYGIFRSDGVTPLPTGEIPLVRALRGEACDEIEIFMRNPRIPDGIFLRCTGRPLHDEGGRLIGGVVVFRDISREIRSVHKFKEDAARVLFELAKKYDPELEPALKRVTEADAKMLGVERVSVWLFNADHSEIACEDLFILSGQRHEKGMRLSAGRYPRYFEALGESRLIDADDAQRDPRTEEFTDGYLRPLGIVSMMDVPVWLHGSVVGVVCHEHVGALRRWTLEERDFAASVADLVSLALEAEERRKLERESEKNLSLLRATLESTADGILVVDRTGKIVSYNRKFADMWGVPTSVLSTRDDEKALQFVLEQLKEPEAFLAKVRGLYAQPAAESFDILEFKDGRVFERYSKPQTMGGENGASRVNTGRVWSFRDVTARRRAEEIKATFASMVSHEIKTPLSAIQESVGVVLDGLDGPVAPAQKKTLQIAKINAEWLGRLINNFLTFSRIESGKMTMQYGRADARSLVEEAFRLMKPAADKKGLQILKSLPEEAVEVRWDADKMKVVAVNLIDNAVKYTDVPGRVRVRLAREGQKVRIEVEDTGIGIREEDMGSIFDMFAQASSRGPWSTGGFGIGLAICKYVVERHGGTLAVESESGKGSRFVVEMPSECTR